MENGVHKTWTPQAEEHYKRVLAGCSTYAQRGLVMGVRDLLKYDLRTRAGKRAVTRGRLRIAVATDEELEEMATFTVVAENESGTIEELLPLQEAEVEELKKLRAKIQCRGIKRSELRASPPDMER